LRDGLYLYGVVMSNIRSTSGLMVEYVVAIDVTRVRFPAGALFALFFIFRGEMLIT
jgi:hypothetical protein